MPPWIAAFLCNWIPRLACIIMLKKTCIKKSEQLYDGRKRLCNRFVNYLLWFAEGVCEIWLTSEDTGETTAECGSASALLWKLVEVIPEGAMLRLGMTNPPYILEHLEVRKSSSFPVLDTDLNQPRQHGGSLSTIPTSFLKTTFTFLLWSHITKNRLGISSPLSFCTSCCSSPLLVLP